VRPENEVRTLPILKSKRTLMKEDMTLGMATRMEDQVPPNRSTGPSPEAIEPVKDSGFRPSRHERKGIVGALAFSLDNLDGCIELIREGKPAPVMQVMEELERDIISQAMTMARANIRGTAFLLGIKYTTLYAKIKKYGLRFTKAVRFYQGPPNTDFKWPGR